MAVPHSRWCSGLLIALMATLAAVTSTGAEGVAGVVWFVQVSDLHFSRFASEQEQLAKFGNKEGDFRELTARVLAPLRPQALVITGDLADSKTRKARGEQFEKEWQAYRHVLDDVVATAGIPETAIHDVRGNHDVYDVPARLGDRDFFSRYATQGRRNGTQRVVLTPVAGVSGAAAICPVAVLVGIDAAPDPGLRGPTNFHGSLDAATLAELDRALADAQGDFGARGCSPVFISYGHYPLSVIQYPDTRPFYAPDPAGPPPQRLGSNAGSAALRPVTLRTVLEKRRVQAYLCGHLHGLFGPRLHRMHPRSSGGHLAELETAGWKDDRRFRLLTVDRGALSFSDLYFNTPTKVKTVSTPLDPIFGTSGSETGGAHRKGYSITSVERSQLVATHIVVVTSPPDARYSPLRTPRAAAPRTFQSVRALVLPIVDAQAIKQVQMLWTCPATAWNGTYPMHRVADGQPLYEADVSTGLECPVPADGGPTIVTVQVVVTEDDGAVSTSEARSVAIAQRDVGTGLLAEPPAALPLGPDASFLGDLVMRSYMPRVAFLLFQYEWAALLALLVLPRFLPPAAVRWLQHGGGFARRALGWALIALHRTSLIAGLWYPQLLYALYLRYGPWFAAQLQAGEPVSVYGPGYLLLAPSPATAGVGREVLRGWRLLRTADTLLLQTVHMAFTVLPLTVWLASLVAALSGRPGDPPLDPFLRQLVIGLHNIAGAAIVWAHLKLWRRLGHLYSMHAVLLSPGFGWTVPLAGLLVIWALIRTGRQAAAAEELHDKEE